MTIKIHPGKKRAGTITIDGVRLRNITCEKYDGIWEINAPNLNLVSLILKQPPSEFGKISQITSASIPELQHLADTLGAEDISLHIDIGKDFELRITVACRAATWEKLWSPNYLFKIISGKIRKTKYKASFRPSYGDYVDIDFLFSTKAKNFPARILAAIDEISSIIFSAAKEIEENQNDKGITIPFRFPPDVRTTCEQYLIYFSQFLADLGIEARSEIIARAERTLFSVIPRDKSQALSQIKEALIAYLELPNAPEEIISRRDNAAIQQLQANIMFLKSQLMLTQATLEQKNATLLMFKNSAQEMIKDDALTQLGRVDGKSTSPSDPEPIFGGLVEVSKYKKYGIQINWHEIARRLKRRK